jgi:tellurite resistance protein
MGSPHLLRARQLLAGHSLSELPDIDRVSGEFRVPKAEGEKSDTLFGAMLEAAFLVTAADGQVSKEELGALVDLVADMTSRVISPGDLGKALEAFSELNDREGRPARLAALAAAVPDAESRRQVLGFAALVALCDHDLAPSELFILHSLGKAFGVETAAVNETIRSLRGALDEKGQ